MARLKKKKEKRQKNAAKNIVRGQNLRLYLVKNCTGTWMRDPLSLAEQIM